MTNRDGSPSEMAACHPSCGDQLAEPRKFDLPEAVARFGDILNNKGGRSSRSGPRSISVNPWSVDGSSQRGKVCARPEPAGPGIVELGAGDQWPGGRGCHATPLTNLGGLCLELLSGKGLESAFLEEIGLKHETVLCHHRARFCPGPRGYGAAPWLHSVRLPPRGHLPNRHNGEPSVLSRSLARCVSFSPRKSGNKSNKPPASTVAGKGFAGHCNPSS